MGDLREQAAALAAETLKRAAADQNVYISLKRAALMVQPVLEAVRPVLIADEAIDQARAAEAEGEAVVETPQPLLPADEVALRKERLQEAVRRIDRAAALHDLRDMPLHALPAEMRTIAAAYADCHLHLRKAASLLTTLTRMSSQHQSAPARAMVWNVRQKSMAVEEQDTAELVGGVSASLSVRVPLSLNSRMFAEPRKHIPFGLSLSKPFSS